MTVEHLVSFEPMEGDDVKVMQLCAHHNDVLDCLILERSMNDGERNEVVQTMLVGVVTFMGPTVFEQHDGCPVCVLEGTLERAADEVMMIRRKAN